MSEKSKLKFLNKESSNNRNLIGVFDSGLGGLTVLKHFLKELPGYNFVYLGDNARLPYGEKSPDTIYHYTREAMDFLFESGCQLIILACNTASSQALHRLQQEYLPAKYPERRILGVIRPLAENITQYKKFKKVGVIGTKATINSQAYEKEIHKLQPHLKVEQISAPLLVPLIEEGWSKKPETKMILKKYLQPLKTKQIEALILGCTHYPWLYWEITRIMGRRIVVPHPGEIIAASLKNYLRRHPELSIRPVARPTRHYYLTDDPKLFKKLAEDFLNQKNLNLQQVEISNL